MLVPGIRSPCHQLCATSGSVLIHHVVAPVLLGCAPGHDGYLPRSGAVQARTEGASKGSRGDCKQPEKEKGCDIGYALAASSCEGANSVDACTVTALDAITAFAVPNPNASSQTPSVFSGLDARPVALPSQSPSLLRFGKVLFKPSLSAVDGDQPKQLLHGCQCRFLVQL
jgi:hypothetical protein